VAIVVREGISNAARLGRTPRRLAVLTRDLPWLVDRNAASLGADERTVLRHVAPAIKGKCLLAVVQATQKPLADHSTLVGPAFIEKYDSLTFQNEFGQINSPLDSSSLYPASQLRTSVSAALGSCVELFTINHWPSGVTS